MAHEHASGLPLSAEKWRQLAEELALSPQQTRIVELILRNFCDKEIAAQLGLKVPTVRTYLQRTYLRLGVEDRMALVLKLFEASQATPVDECHHK